MRWATRRGFMAMERNPMTSRVLQASQQPSPASTAPVSGTELDASPQRLRSLARAAQQDILRRLAPLLREEMLVQLQCLGMLAETLNARLERGVVAPELLQEAVPKLNRLSHEAVGHCLDVCTWMEAAEDDIVCLRDGVDELVRLLSTSLNFRGFDLRTERAEGSFHVCRSALRFLLAGAILALVDTARTPGVIALRTEHSSLHGVVALECTAAEDGPSTQVHDAGQAPLSWTELQALAQQHGAELRRSGSAIVLRLPRARVTTPLKMIPV